MDTSYNIERLKFYIDQIRVSVRSDSFLFKSTENGQIQEKIDEFEQFLTDRYEAVKNVS